MEKMHKPPFRFRVFFFLTTPAVAYVWFIGQILGIRFARMEMHKHRPEESVDIK